MSTFVLRSALFIVPAGLALSGSLLSASPVVIGIQLCAPALGAWARRPFPAGSFRIGGSPAADEVIRRGPYRWLRHPMYAAMLLFVWSGAAASTKALVPLVV